MGQIRRITQNLKEKMSLSGRSKFAVQFSSFSYSFSPVQLFDDSLENSKSSNIIFRTAHIHQQTAHRTEESVWFPDTNHTWVPQLHVWTALPQVTLQKSQQLFLIQIILSEMPSDDPEAQLLVVKSHL